MYNAFCQCASSRPSSLYRLASSNGADISIQLKVPRAADDLLTEQGCACWVLDQALKSSRRSEAKGSNYQN